MKKLLITFCIGLALNVHGQINTDRPTQSFSPFVMPIGKVQAEFGFVSERPDSKVDLNNLTYLNALVRIGVLDWMELRVTENVIGVKSNSSSINGLSPTTLGAKFHLMNEQNGLPQLGLISSITLANGQDQFKANETIQDIRLLFQNSLSDKFTLAYNVGTYWSKSSDQVGIYTLMLGYSATDVVSLFIEPYGFFASGSPADNRLNGGAIFLISDNFQADVSTGFGLSNSSPDHFFGFGLAYLF